MSAVVAVLAACAAADVQLLRVTCSGAIELFPDKDVGLTLDLPNQRKALDTAYDTLRSRLRCHCKDLTNEEIASRFDPVEVVLNLIRGKPESETKIDCIDETSLYTRDMHKWLAAQFRDSQIDVPDTCTAAAYRSGEGCRFTLRTKPEFSADLSVAVARCSIDSAAPSIGIWCRGQACDTLFHGCSGNDDCASGQECQDFLSASNANFGDAKTAAAIALQLAFGLNTTSAWQHISLALGAQLTSKCETMADGGLYGAFGRFVGFLTGGTPTGVCLPKKWEGFGTAAQEYYKRGWEELTGMPRTDECSPFVQRKDSQFNWRRGQITDYGLSGGGWCTGFEDCNFHQNAGDCESNDDFEYFMGKLYCKYKGQDRCLEYSPFCYWDPKVRDKHKCLFNESTQWDGIDEKADWKNGLVCDDHAERCGIIENRLPKCENEFCRCKGGVWDGETETCEEPENGPKCPNLLPCWGGYLQCYEKSGEKHFQDNARACEEHFMCKCIEVAEGGGCDAKTFCGRRCACMHTEKDRFVGAYCDVRLNRGDEAVVLTYNPDLPAPIASWDGKLSDGKLATAGLKGSPSPTPPAAAKADSGLSPVAVTTCDGQVWFLPGSPVGFYAHFRGLGQLASAVGEEVAAIATCVAGQAADSYLVERSFLPHMPAMWLDWLVGDKAPAFPAASLSDWLFNSSGTRYAEEPDPHELIAMAQLHQLLTSPPPVMDGGPGYHGLIFTSLQNGLRTVWSTFTASLRTLGWLSLDTWYYALYATQSEQNDEVRREKVREIVTGRQELLMERQSQFFETFSRGRIAEPEGSEAVRDVWRTKGRAGLLVNMDEGSQAVLHAERCPAGGLAAYQIGVTDPLASNFKMTQKCKTDADCEAEGAGRCVRLDSRFFDTHLYGADFVAGFLWGGNFTKGFIGGCPIMSTTISMNSLSTTTTQCVQRDSWARDVATNVVRLTERTPSEYDSCTDEECLFHWCYSNPQTSAANTWEANAADGVFNGAEAAHNAPFVVKSTPPSRPAQKPRSNNAQRLEELKKKKNAAVDAEDYDEAKRLKKLILELQKDEL
eukprot:Hpha_TRINITY_DN16911_c2_g1::TRINITY_DN16911_c2_g1_i1::g.52357::m.52357